MKRSKALAAVVTLIAMASCLSDSHLSASNLEIAPSPAVPGDVVVASVDVMVVPVQRHVVVLTIDGTEHVRVTNTTAPDSPQLITVGAAADLIATYGAGVHTARVEVRAEESGETARTQTASFELRQAAP